MNPTDLHPGSLILYDLNEHRTPPECILRGIVESIQGDEITFSGGFKRKIERCAGIPVETFIDRIPDWLRKEVESKGIKYYHEAQNLYKDTTGQDLKLTPQ